MEVSIALGVAAFCLLAILGLLQTGLTSEKATVGQTAAAGILSSVFSDLASASSANSTTQLFKIALDGQSSASSQTIYFTEAGEPTGALGGTPTAESRYRATIGIQSPNPGVKAPTTVRILITWPAEADPIPNQWPSKASGAVEVVTALDRN